MRSNYRDWLVKWAVGEEGYNHCCREKEREKHTVRDHILWGAYPCLGTKASSALLNGKLHAALGNMKAKWKALTHTIPLCGNVYLEKLEIELRYQGDGSGRSDKEWRLEAHSFRNSDVPSLALAECGQHVSFGGKCPLAGPPNLFALHFPRLLPMYQVLCVSLKSPLLWEAWPVVSFPFNEMRITWAGGSLLKLPFFQFLVCILGCQKHTGTYMTGFFLHERGEGCHSLWNCILNT